MKVKVESEKAGLKLNIQKTKIMASSPITSWDNPDNHDDMITDLEPDFLECEVKWALESIITKHVEVMKFQLSYLKI